MNTTLNSNGRNYGNTDLFLGYITVLLFILLIFILKMLIFLNIKCKNLTDKLKCMCEFVFRYFTINRENENKLYCQVCLHIRGICYSDRNMNAGYTFTFMHLADAFIQSDLQYIPAAISLRLQGKLSFPYNCQKMNGQIYVLLC